MAIDYLFFGAHPDDVELSCSGTILKLVAEQKTVAIVDLTEGELGSRGDVQTRYAEAAQAKKMLGVAERINLKMRDGFFKNDETQLVQIIDVIRRYCPRIIVANAPKDRHPDHGRAAQLVAQAAFLSGLVKIKTQTESDTWRPQNLFYYIQDIQLEPHFLIDITPFFDQKKKVIGCYESQFFSQTSYLDAPQTYISSELFWTNLDVKARAMGQKVGVEYAEGYITHQPSLFANFDAFLPTFF